MSATVTPNLPSVPRITRTQNLIDNTWMDPVGGQAFATYNPATGDIIAEVAESGSADVDMAVSAAVLSELPNSR